MAVFCLLHVIGMSVYFKAICKERGYHGYHGSFMSVLWVKLLKIMFKINANFANT